MFLVGLLSLVVSIILMFVDWPILDPLLSIAFTLFILFNVVKNLKSTLALFLQASPDEETQNKITDALLSKSEVERRFITYIIGL